MILKGSQRSGGADLATHLLNSFDNETVEIAQITNTVFDDLHGAFAEFEAIASGTRCQKPLYSLSINPSFPLSKEQYFTAIDRIAEGLGLKRQPRAVIFHRKSGREHCHVVWSRIDHHTLKAIHISYDRFKLKELAKQLADEFGLSLPPGLTCDEEPNASPPEPTLTENAQSQQTGISPEERRFQIAEAYLSCDKGESFRNALLEIGYHLATGKKRAFVIVDAAGQVHSLTRYIKDVRTKHIKQKLSDLDPSALPTVDQVKATLVKPPPAKIDPDLYEKLQSLKDDRRNALRLERQDVETTNFSERLALKKTQAEEYNTSILSQLIRAVKLACRVPGFKRIALYIATSLRARVRYKHKEALVRLTERHHFKRLRLKAKERALKKIEAYENRSFQAALRRLSRNSGQSTVTVAPTAQNRNDPQMTTQHRISEPQDSEEQQLEREYQKSSNSDHDAPSLDPEIVELERQYGWSSLTRYFNLLANPNTNEDETGFLDPKPQPRPKR